MHPACVLCGGHPLYTVDAALKLEAPIHALPCNARAGQLEAPRVAACLLQHLCHTATLLTISCHAMYCPSLWVETVLLAFSTIWKAPLQPKIVCLMRRNLALTSEPSLRQPIYAYLKFPALLFREALVHFK